jgi:hypothetical protein
VIPLRERFSLGRSLVEKLHDVLANTPKRCGFPRLLRKKLHSLAPKLDAVMLPCCLNPSRLNGRILPANFASVGPITVREGRSATGGERKSYTQKKFLFWRRKKKVARSITRIGKNAPLPHQGAVFAHGRIFGATISTRLKIARDGLSALIRIWPSHRATELAGRVKASSRPRP